MIRFALMMLALLTFGSNAHSSTLLICKAKSAIAKYPNEKVIEIPSSQEIKLKIDRDTILTGNVNYPFLPYGYKIISGSAGDELGIVGVKETTINKKNTAPDIITIFGTAIDSAVSITSMTGLFLRHDTYKCRRL